MGVKFAYDLARPLSGRTSALDDQHKFVGGFNGVAPAIDAAHAGDDVDAGRGAAADKFFGDAARNGAVRRCRIEENDVGVHIAACELDWAVCVSAAKRYAVSLAVVVTAGCAVQALDRGKALVLYSGGQDSAIALGWALSRFARVETIGFDYGQRHSIELVQRVVLREAIIAAKPAWRDRLGGDALLDLRALGALSDTALTRQAAISVDAATGLPTTFVPGRNLIFLTFAAAAAFASRARTLVGGMCEADYSGYPDCRREALDAQMRALNAGMEADFVLETPLSPLTKAQSWRLAHELGGEPFVEAILEHSHSCYLGERGARRDWGYGCGACPACELREKGWRDHVGARP